MQNNIMKSSSSQTKEKGSQQQNKFCDTEMTPRSSSENNDEDILLENT